MKNILKNFILIFSVFLASCGQNIENKNILEDFEKSNTWKVSEIEKKFYVDVRTDEEWAEWHIKWAKHVKLADIQNGINIDRIPKDIPVHIYCRSWNRSAQAIKILQEKHGYKNLIDAWWMKSIKNVEIVK